ncbi:hypothetical protein BMF77_01056 [Dolichospermum sp. UHCC 0315A]|jgi:hypothetical protein|uniref:hypothetical protein n=1 Tax=Dolichospermum sp. UHCC 0315A TaxID=1914871 RepID=UPI0011E77388|nr:hypothetical protein [Dolichospermum sp. UHCC 0315A]QEI40487.1 hypothetical protein BMF77_01056 [Dolichospermum sp. UHCC 0315A]
MSSFVFYSIKNALSKALESLPDWKSLNPFEKGQQIDKSFKVILQDLMKQFNMKPGVDYVDNLKDNEQSTDFVALSQKADDLIQGLLTGKIVAISEYSKVSKLGNQFTVKAHFRDIRKSA